MKSFTTAIAAGISIVSLATSGHAIAVTTPAYSVIDLGTLGGASSTAAGVNDKGQVCGYAETGFTSTESFLSGACGGGFKVLGTVPSSPFTTTIATAVNSSGVVAGFFFPANIGDPQDFITDRNGYNTRILNTPTGYISIALGLNDHGRVCGQFGNFQFTHAFLSDDNGGTKRDLGTIGDAWSSAHWVNKYGQIAGVLTMPDFSTHALISGQNGAFLRDLGTVNGNSTAAECINSSGEIAGEIQVLAGSHLLVSGPNGSVLQDAGSLGGLQTLAFGINDAGTVVGESDITGNVARHGFIYVHGVITDINTLIGPNAGWVISDARGISNTGCFIAANSTDARGFSHALLLYRNATNLAAPSNLVATGHDGSVSLTWTGSTGAQSYVIYRSTAPGGVGNRPLNAGIAVTSYTDTNRKNGVTYYYKVAAESTSGISAQSSEAQATPLKGL